MSNKLALVVGACLSIACSMAGAQDYPNRSIRLVLPRAPGGASDLIARAIAPKLTATLGQSVVVDNQPGANGTIAEGFVAKANRDGYTLLLADDAHPINPILLKDMQYDPATDLQPVSLLATQSMLMTVNPSVPAKTLPEFIALAKAGPKKYSYSSAGIGSAQHLSTLGIANAAGIELLHVPYKSGAVIGAISGEVAVFSGSLASIVGYVEAGKLRALALTSAKRSPLLPNVPTVREQNIPFEFVAWEGIMVPTGTSKALIAKLHAALVAVMKSSEVQQQLADKMTLVGSSPDEFARLIASERTRWTAALKNSANVQQ